jgi:hypothetical protein
MEHAAASESRAKIVVMDVRSSVVVNPLSREASDERDQMVAARPVSAVSVPRTELRDGLLPHGRKLLPVSAGCSVVQASLAGIGGVSLAGPMDGALRPNVPFFLIYLFIFFDCLFR